MDVASRRRALSLVIAAGLAAALLYYSLRGVDWRILSDIVGGAEPGALVLGALLGTVSLFVRAWRWRILLRAGGPISLTAAFFATAAGAFGNNFLPARAGELVRTYMISSRSTLHGSFVLATALAERVADAIALALISAAILLAMPDPPGWLAAAALPFAAVALMGALAIILLPLLGPAARAIVRRAPLPARLQPRLASAVDNALGGIRAFHHPGRLAAFVVVTIALWITDGVGGVIVARALGLHLTLAVSLLLIAGLGVATALPSTPGYIGIYQFVAVTMLMPFGFTRTDAIAFILVVQALNYGVIAGWGVFGWVGYRRSRSSA
jgi:uncharacterized protein (TIRG00374 family)